MIVSTRYAYNVRSDIEAFGSKLPILRRATAGLFTVAVAVFATHAIVEFVPAFWIVVTIAAVAAVLWALSALP